MSDEDGTKPPRKPIIDLTQYRESRRMETPEPTDDEAQSFRNITEMVTYLNAMRDQLVLAGWDEEYAQSISATILVHRFVEN